MNLLTIAGVIVAFCCVQNVVQVRAGGSLPQSAGSVSQSVGSAKDAVELANELLELKDNLKNKKPPSRPHRRNRRGTSLDKNEDLKASIVKVGEAIDHLLIRKPYAAVESLFGNEERKQAAGEVLSGFRDAAIRPAFVTQFPPLRTLNGPLNKPFKELHENGRKVIGDIISCQLANYSMPGEHYMMVINDTHLLEVAAREGGKSTNNVGGVKLHTVQETGYYDSKECLYHENAVVEAAMKCDEEKDKKKVKDYVNYYKQRGYILERAAATIKELAYSVLSCNCQDLALYWAYGYANTPACILQFFPDQKIKHWRSVAEIREYIDNSCKE